MRIESSKYKVRSAKSGRRSAALLLSFFVTFVVESSFAQFNEAVWPAWSHPRDQKYQISDLCSGLYERVVVTPPRGPPFPFTYRDLPGTPAWYRLNRSLLAAYKAGAKAYCLPHFYNASAWTNTGATSGPPAWTVTTLCQALTIPTNYFDYTPWRGISGVGGYTNDASLIGHSHGETNSDTARGGTNFPAGRTCWYTTDYGIDQLRSALTTLVYTACKDNVAWGGGGDRQTFYPGYPADPAPDPWYAGAHDIDYTGTNWLPAMTNAEAKWGDPVYLTFGQRNVGSVGVNSYGDHKMTWLVSRTFAFFVPDYNTEYGCDNVLATNRSHTVAFYYLGAPIGYQYGSGEQYTNEWDANGATISTNAYTFLSESAESFGQSVTSSVFGDLNMPHWFSTPPVDEPPVNSGLSCQRGFALDSFWGITKWNFLYQ